MRTIKRAVLLLMLSVDFSVMAQPRPTVHVDHDWTFSCGGEEFGVRQWYFTGAPRCQTSVFLGRWNFRVGMPAIPLICIVAAPFVVAGILVMNLRTKR